MAGMVCVTPRTPLAATTVSKVTPNAACPLRRPHILPMTLECIARVAPACLGRAPYRRIL